MKLSVKIIIIAIIIVILAAISLLFEPKYVSDWKKERANQYLIN